jgi:DNA-binding MarR family transcriptional regulator
MTKPAAAKALMELYPKVFFACHRRHVRDARTGRILSAHQASILDHLDDAESLGLTALAAHMGVTASTMSLAIDRLEAGGYVRRGRDRGDGRKVSLRLTAAGARIKQKQSVLDPAAVTSLLSRLSPAQRAAAIEGLAVLAGAAEAQMQSRTTHSGPRG